MTQPQVYFVKARTLQNPRAEDGITTCSIRSHVATVVHQRRRQEERRKYGNAETQIGHRLPDPRMFQGNSDPFNCLPIKITPTVNAEIRFRKIYRIPSWTSSWARVVTEDPSKRHEEASLQDSSSASAYALYCFSLQGRLAEVSSRTGQHEKLELKVQSLAMLRHNLQVHVVDEGMLHAMMWLFRSAVIAGDLIEARKHGIMLRTLIVGESHKLDRR